jgi:LmbE family N-acetylglucosaminyl deacetylase
MTDPGFQAWLAGHPAPGDPPAAVPGIHGDDLQRGRIIRAELGVCREREAIAAAGTLGVPEASLRFLRFANGGVDRASLVQVGAVVVVLPPQPPFHVSRHDRRG